MSKADLLGASSSFGQASQARSVRRQVIDATLGGEPTELPLALISQNPDNPRACLPDVTDLAATIAEIGLINPITVASVEAWLRERPERTGELNPAAEYLVIDGNRRLAAAEMAGLTRIDVHINDTLASSDEKVLEAAFVANVQRADMTDLEEAQALEKLVEFYGSQRKASQRLGLSQAVISQRLSLLKLAPELQADRKPGTRKLEHVRALASLPPEEQKKKADARAEAAQQEATDKKRRRQEAPGAASGDYGVITPSVPGPEPMPVAPPAPRSPTTLEVTAPAADDNGTKPVCHHQCR